MLFCFVLIICTQTHTRRKNEENSSNSDDKRALLDCEWHRMRAQKNDVKMDLQQTKQVLGKWPKVGKLSCQEQQNRKRKTKLWINASLCRSYTNSRWLLWSLLVRSHQTWTPNATSNHSSSAGYCYLLPEQCTHNLSSIHNCLVDIPLMLILSIDSLSLSFAVFSLFQQLISCHTIKLTAIKYEQTGANLTSCKSNVGRSYMKCRKNWHYRCRWKLQFAGRIFETFIYEQ